MYFFKILFSLKVIRSTSGMSSKKELGRGAMLSEPSDSLVRHVLTWRYAPNFCAVRIFFMGFMQDEE
jgi:hypothetical protein